MRRPADRQLKMAEIHSILTLRSRGWSFRRITGELGVHRETVARYVQRAGASMLPEAGFSLKYRQVLRDSGLSWVQCRWSENAGPPVAQAGKGNPFAHE